MAKRGGVSAMNYVLHIPRQFATPKAGIFTFCNRRAVDVNCVGADDAEKIEENPEAQCRVCMRAWRKRTGSQVAKKPMTPEAHDIIDGMAQMDLATIEATPDDPSTWEDCGSCRGTGSIPLDAEDQIATGRKYRQCMDCQGEGTVPPRPRRDMMP